MKKWYLFYSQDAHYDKLQQLGGEIQGGTDPIDGEAFPLPFAFVPWGHHIQIITKCKHIDEALFYIRRIPTCCFVTCYPPEFFMCGWGRGVTVQRTRFMRMMNVADSVAGLSQVVSQVMSQVKGLDLRLVTEVECVVLLCYLLPA